MQKMRTLIIRSDDASYLTPPELPSAIREAHRQAHRTPKRAALVTEMPHACEHKRDLGVISGGDHLIIAH
jgi:hypothetical protein